MKLKYNLQYFAEGEPNGDDASSNDSTGSADNDSNTGNDEVDVQAFAEIISEKDKKLDELTEEVTKLKKSNAELLLRISSSKPDTFDFDKAVMSFDTRAQS